MSRHCPKWMELVFLATVKPVHLNTSRIHVTFKDKARSKQVGVAGQTHLLAIAGTGPRVAPTSTFPNTIDRNRYR